MTNNRLQVDEETLVISYLTLRKAVGILGTLFPLILVIGALVAGTEDFFQDSISEYYYTEMRDLFVGILCAIALFLFSYNGYEKKDAIAGDLACVFALGTAFFPTSNSFTGIIHFIAAGLLFLTLAYFSLYLFTKGSSSPTKEKEKRNRLYRICGFIILGCILLLILYSILPSNLREALSDYHPVFWFETLALWAFGLSWLTKGEFLLKDEENG